MLRHGRRVAAIDIAKPCLAPADALYLTVRGAVGRRLGVQEISPSPDLLVSCLRCREDGSLTPDWRSWGDAGYLTVIRTTFAGANRAVAVLQAKTARS